MWHFDKIRFFDLKVYGFGLGWSSVVEGLPDMHKPSVPCVVTQTTKAQDLSCEHLKNFSYPALVRKKQTNKTPHFYAMLLL